MFGEGPGLGFRGPGRAQVRWAELSGIRSSHGPRLHGKAGVRGGVGLTETQAPPKPPPKAPCRRVQGRVPCPTERPKNDVFGFRV